MFVIVFLSLIFVLRLYRSNSLPVKTFSVVTLSVIVVTSSRLGRPAVSQVHQFSNKQTEMALRVASLDYLGTVAARLRKDAVTSSMDQKSIDRILREVNIPLLQFVCLAECSSCLG